MIGICSDRNRSVVLRDVVQQPGDRERLAVAQLDVGFGAASDSAGMRNPRLTPLAKSSELTSGRTFSRIRRPRSSA